MKINSHNQGMALILTLITVSAIITITVSMIGLSLQQLQLSIDARDSERAFHAASAGIECGQFTIVNSSLSTIVYNDDPITANCMNETETVTGISITPSISGSVPGAIIDQFFYEIEPSLSGRNTCVQIDLSIMRSSTSTPMSHDFGGQIGEVTCTQSSVCSVVVSRGFNHSCAGVPTGSYEILRELNAIF